MTFDTKLRKQPRQTSESYLVFIRSKPCAICGAVEVDAHHLTSRGAWGSDFSCVPLCRLHHNAYHTKGQADFEILYKVNLWKDAWQLLLEYFTEGVSIDAAAENDEVFKGEGLPG